MLDLITSLLGASEQIFGYLGTKENQKYIDKCVDIRQRIQAAWAQWPNWDDSEIENLWKDLKVIEDALSAQIQVKRS